MPARPVVMIRPNLMRGPPRLNGQVPFAHHFAGVVDLPQARAQN